MMAYSRKLSAQWTKHVFKTELSGRVRPLSRHEDGEALRDITRTRPGGSHDPEHDAQRPRIDGRCGPCRSPCHSPRRSPTPICTIPCLQAFRPDWRGARFSGSRSPFSVFQVLTSAHLVDFASQITRAALVGFLLLPCFPLHWTPSVERIDWVETWRIASDGLHMKKPAQYCAGFVVVIALRGSRQPMMRAKVAEGRMTASVLAGSVW
jgi:hypothetical protein